MLKRSAVVVLPLMLVSCADPGSVTDPELAPRFAATVVTTNERVPLDLQAFVPCADDGAGELVQLSGPLHVLIHTTVDNKGGMTVRSQFQPQGVGGYGLTTGAKYQATGVTQETFTTNGAATHTLVNNFRMIGQGTGNNFQVHQNTHITVDANGTVRVDVDNTRTECG